jgi:hypothetical protein
VRGGEGAQEAVENPYEVENGEPHAEQGLPALALMAGAR